MPSLCRVLGVSSIQGRLGKAQRELPKTTTKKGDRRGVKSPSLFLISSILTTSFPSNIEAHQPVS